MNITYHCLIKNIFFCVSQYYFFNVKILNEGNGTRVSDIGEFCEELAILDSSPNIKKSPKVKLEKKTKQTTLF